MIKPTMELDGYTFQKVAPRTSLKILSNLDQASAMEVVFDSMQIALSVKRSDNQIIESSYFDGLNDNDNWNNEKYDNDVDFDLS